MQDNISDEEMCYWAWEYKFDVRDGAWFKKYSLYMDAMLIININ